jgi:hypothetical protein
MQLNRHDLKVLAIAASYGSVSVGDFVAAPKRTARLSKTYRTRVASVNRRLRSLARASALQDSGFGNFIISEAGLLCLRSAGFHKTSSGMWKHPDFNI